MKEIYLIYRSKKMIYAVSTFEKAVQHIAELNQQIGKLYHYEKLDYYE